MSCATGTALGGLLCIPAQSPHAAIQGRAAQKKERRASAPYARWPGLERSAL